MSEFSKRKDALREQIDDLERAVADLKHELQAEEEREQHQAIDRLEEYLGELDNKNAKLQDFWQVLREEMNQMFGRQSDMMGKNK